MAEGRSGSDEQRPRRSVFTRREFVAAGASALVVVGAAGTLVVGQRGSAPSGPPPPLRFLSEDEGRVVTALAERIFPADDSGPGSTDLRVVNYIDGQLAGAWGQGSGMYRSGPFETPTDTGHGWQHDLTPAQAFRRGLAALGRYTQKTHGAGYDALSGDQQDQVLTALVGGKVDTFDAPTAVEFAAQLRESVVEGLFSDPHYGGNHNLAGWQWLGFPGDPMAYNDPYEKYIDNWAESYDVDPKSAYSS